MSDIVPPRIEHYAGRISLHETDVARRLREETARLPQANMQLGADAASLLALVVRMIGARRCLEVGTFTGYSALVVASALPEDGRIVCCDVSDEWTSIARRYWAEAGVDRKIDLRLGPAGDTLAALLRSGGPESFDFAFIDADKSAYDGYYEACLQLVRPGGVIAIDNVLWSGKVVDDTVSDGDTTALRALNEKIGQDRRVVACLLTVRDGIMLAWKKT